MRPARGLDAKEIELASETTSKYRELRKHRLLSLAHQLLGIVKNGSHTAMPSRDITDLSLQKIEALPNFGGNIGQDDIYSFNVLRICWI